MSKSVDNTITLQKFFSEATVGSFTGDSQLVRLILDISAASIKIAETLKLGELAHNTDTCFIDPAGMTNVQGEVQKKLDVISNQIFIDCTVHSGTLAGLASEEMELPFQIPSQSPRGKFLLVFDPLDGSSNLDVNVTVGSVFSVLQASLDAVSSARDVSESDFLQAGVSQVAAGYAIYGPNTMFVFSTGQGVNGFTLDPKRNQFFLTHPNLHVTTESHEFAINSSNSRFWDAPVTRYVDECMAGITGVRATEFNMRWVASMVADAHRILLRGGIFLYPCDSKHADKGGRLRLLYEANPIAYLMQQAGGRASTGFACVLHVTPTSLHQRIGLVFGSSSEVDRLDQYHLESANLTDIVCN